MIINDLAFNPDYSSLSISTSENHKIFNCDPFGELYSSAQNPLRKSLSNSIENEEQQSQTAKPVEPDVYPTKLLKMLFSTSLTIIVPEDDNILKIYNLKQNLKIMDLKFESSVIDVKLNRKRLVVVLQSGEIQIYDLSCLKLLKTLKIKSTIEHGFIGDLSINDLSWLCLPLNSLNDSSLVNEQLNEYIAITPKIKETKILDNPKITIDDLNKEGHGWLLVYDTINLKPMIIFKAHDSEIGKISISHLGSKIATASTKGTIIRVFDLVQNEEDKVTLSSVKNLRRGHNLTTINSLSFHNQDLILGCGSESSTIHLFKLSDKDINLDENEDGRDIYDHSDEQSDGEANRSSSDDLNESLANLLLYSQEEKPQQQTKSKSWFKKTKKKFINNQYTSSILKNIPYKDLFDNLIWEPPTRSFAYVKLPEHTYQQHNKNKVEIGFYNDLIFIASYQTGKFYQYQLPKQRTGITLKSNKDKSDDKENNQHREECSLINQYDMI
ncbi:atg18 [Candida pseudojiufengensis]|uniref:atg18 n=1 Tax=Candida pseudojiufengensis TaxID=497109 RepID=UPI0022254028|nr:atg18 [Candida pseudojiufengensis]KAI5966253.1 atg18 [Candida pseudojiufengensis]